eukprot:TRINITY_DN10543_c0_g1_i6.p1 TRINITY_DN10543_c0_g1~~TRINITY_DN10543_c0_g1_i6.p1  ORF type:complete len:502 (-),score=100.49 TRINITY_DN10543_c0_g1_i6:142-1647(-)
MPSMEWQPSLQAWSRSPMEHVEPGTIAAGACLLIILMCRSTIDQAASTYLNPGNWKRNEELRRAWSLFTAMPLSFGIAINPSQVLSDPALVVLACVMVPWVLATSSRDHHQKLSGLTIAAFYGWFALRQATPNTAQLFPEPFRDGFFAAWFMCYLEVSVDRLGTMVLNHMILISVHVLPILMAGTLLTTGMVWHLAASVTMLALFCWRRRREFVRVMANQGGLCPSTQACTLVELVLESSDELCESSKEMLIQVVLLLRHSDDMEKSPVRRRSEKSSESKFGKGNGSGDQDGVLADMANIIAIDEPQVELDLFEFDKLLHSSGSNPDNNAAWPIGHAKQEQTQAVSPATRLPLSQQLPFAEELLSMTSDAMAQVDLGSGTLLWQNRYFDQLATGLGDGDPWQGQKILFREFLQNVPQELWRVEKMTYTSTAAIEINSVTRIVGDAGSGTVLWAIRAVSHARTPIVGHPSDEAALSGSGASNRNPPVCTPCLLYTSPSPRDS